MRSQLILIHRALGEGSLKPFSPAAGGAVWTTCLRSIAIGSPDIFAAQMQGADQLISGVKAFEFLLETVCGLNSPVKGETEVHGQFKRFLDEAKTLLPSAIFKSLHQVHVDAKRVRTSCLRNLGSQSYGSFCRRHLRGLRQVNLIGSGHLAHELLPWLVKTDSAVNVFCRTAHRKKAEIQSRFQTVTVNEIFSATPSAEKESLSGALIIAAPVKSAEVVAWLERAAHGIELVIDLRAESTHDPMPAFANGVMINLKNVFEAIETVRAKINSEVEKAISMIKEITRESAENDNFRAHQDFGTQERSGASSSLSSRTSA